MAINKTHKKATLTGPLKMTHKRIYQKKIIKRIFNKKQKNYKIKQNFQMVNNQRLKFV